MKINKKIKESKWCKFEGKVEFQIRPFKFSKFKLDDVSAGLKEKFIYCLTDWKGLTEEDDKTLFKCTTENKELLYDYYDNVREFVFAEVQKQQDKLEKSIKN